MAIFVVTLLLSRKENNLPLDSGNFFTKVKYQASMIQYLNPNISDLLLPNSAAELKC